MSWLTLLVLLLLVLVVLLFAAGLAYVAYHHPALAMPLMVATGGATVVVTLVAAIVSR
ncbi:hypothetical protein ACFZB6_29475 [Streptomyces syringium]|uniref:hypothetical protein n=1 Tax=Streptomyces syringium TaxID=76729 RepID=UPI0036E412D8